MKDVIWLGDSRDNVRAFPLPARRAIGEQLMRVQYGRDPLDWKPMGTIGPGVREIRVRAGEGAFRAIYTTKLDDVVYILHAFQKKGQKTGTRDIDLARQRLNDLRRQRP